MAIRLMRSSSGNDKSQFTSFAIQELDIESRIGTQQAYNLLNHLFGSLSDGVHGMVGAEAVVRQDGLVQLNGELWRARSSGGEELVVGEHVLVEKVEDDLRLVVGLAATATGEEPH